MDRSEIFVVDNASGDGSVEMLRDHYPWVCVLANEENVGFGRANVQAYERSRGRFVLLLNPDTVVLGGGPIRMLEHLEQHPKVGILGCRLVNGDGTLQRWTGGRFPTVWNSATHYLFLDKLLVPLHLGQSMYLPRDLPGNTAVDWVCGACMMIRRKAMPDPLFDPAYFLYGEDLDLCRRVKQAGWQVVYSTVATVIHYHGASTKQQTGALSLSGVKGLREFFRSLRGARQVFLFDLITISGFALRCCAYAGLAALRPRNRSTREKLSSSWQHLSKAVELLGH